jgi:cytochrome P450
MTVAGMVRLNDSYFHTFEAERVFARLRQEDPVHWHEPLETWVISKYEDVKHVSCHPEVFSVQHGIRLDEACGARLAEGIFADGGEFLAYTDPPRHTELRRMLASAFTPRAVTARTERIEDIASEVVSTIEAGVVIDWVDIAARLPILVMLDLLGLPAQDVDDVRRWSNGMERLSFPLTHAELDDAVAQFAPLTDYLREHIRHKQSHPADDLMSLLVDQQRQRPSVSDANIVTFLQTILGAGNDTTRSLLSGMVVALAQHPLEMKVLVANPMLVSRAVEEALRWITPARGFMRTVVHPTVLRGNNLRPMEHVYLAYDSANRDEDVFEDPYSFSVSEARSPHASFGFGTHVCLGSAFARLEAVATLKALLARFHSVQVISKPERVVSVLREGFSSVRVAFY